jgi:hypothetical protein
MDFYKRLKQTNGNGVPAPLKNQEKICAEREN